MFTCRPWSCAVVLALAALVGRPGSAAADVIVSVTQVGTPNWRPTDFHLFTAPAEPLATTGVNTVQSIIPQPFHVVTPGGVVLPGAAHPGPYTSELAAGLAALRIPDRTTFLPSEMAGTPNAIWFAYTLVPNPGVTGSSPDFASGPVIPESVFPIVATAQILRDGAPYDTSGATTRALAALTPPFPGFTGSSHRSQFLFSDLATADNPLRLGVQDLAGHQYQFVVQLRDAQGNGFNLVSAFAVAPPEPATATVFAVLGLTAAARTVRRRAVPARRA